MHVGISRKTRQVVVPPDQRIQMLIPHATLHRHNGKDYWLVPHRIQEAKLLTNLGYDVPSPIMTHYNWRRMIPFDSQKVTAEMLTQQRRAFVLNDMGTGKTLSALFAADFLMQIGEIKSALIIAPLSTLTTVWEREIFTRMPDRTAVSLHGTRTKRLQRLAEPFDFYIINPDGLNIIRDAINDRPDINLIILDELTCYRNKRTNRWKYANAIIRKRKYVWGMTGAPTPNAPTDAWAQTLLIAPDNVPRYFKQFRDQTMLQVTQYKWIPKKEAASIVNAVMQPAIRFTRDECIDLPALTFTDLECDMSPVQLKAYKEMLTKFAVQIAEGKITAANAGVQMSKLLQLAGGFIYGPNGQAESINAAPREALLEEIMEEVGPDNKMIIFAPFRHLVKHLHMKLGASHRVASITGETSKAERDEIFNLFQNSSAPQFLIAHPGTMAHGVNLHRANFITWYSPTVSLEIYDQANARIPRPGQKKAMSIIHVIGSPIEKAIYKRLQSKSAVQNLLLEMFQKK